MLLVHRVGRNGPLRNERLLADLVDVFKCIGVTGRIVSPRPGESPRRIERCIHQCPVI